LCILYPSIWASWARISESSWFLSMNLFTAFTLWYMKQVNKSTQKRRSNLWLRCPCRLRPAHLCHCPLGPTRGCRRRGLVLEALGICWVCWCPQAKEILIKWRGRCYGLEQWGKSSVESNELPVDDGADGEQVKWLHKHVVDVLVVLVETYLKKSYFKNNCESFVHSALKLKKLVICLHSWFPLRKKTLSLKQTCDL
jgi:hypothetical protein